METVYSLNHERTDGTAVVFDFVVSREGAGWWRHDFDPEGGYAAVSPCEVGDIRRELAASPATFVIELRSAASALETAVGDLLEVGESAALAGELAVADRLTARAGQVERERLCALDEVVLECDAAWESALARVSSARSAESGDLPGAIRTVELLWTARQAVRRMLGARRESSA